jgi:hypothetical protein
MNNSDGHGHICGAMPIDGAVPNPAYAVVRTATWRDPLPPLAYISSASVGIIHLWAFQQGGRRRRLRCILGLLDREYLLEAPLPQGIHVQEGRRGGERLRYLWRRQTAALLGWTSRREEGSSDGFSDVVNFILRRDIFPDH